MLDGTLQVVTVALDTTLDDALRDEGVAREFVSRVQSLRKEAGFCRVGPHRSYLPGPPGHGHGPSSATRRRFEPRRSQSTSRRRTTRPARQTATEDFGAGDVRFAVRRASR